MLGSEDIVGEEGAVDTSRSRGCFGGSKIPFFSAILGEENKFDANLIRTRLICTGKLTRSRLLMSPCCKAVKDDSGKRTVNLFLLLLPRRMPNEL